MCVFVCSFVSLRQNHHHQGVDFDTEILIVQLNIFASVFPERHARTCHVFTPFTFHSSDSVVT